MVLENLKPRTFERLPREIFTPQNSRTVQLGHDSDSVAYFTGAEPKYHENLSI